MKIQVASDLHVEHFSDLNKFHEQYKLVKETNFKLFENVIGDILILAGDVANVRKSSFKEFLQEISIKFSHILMVAGNHEYYGNDYNSCLEQMKNICKEFTNIYFLDKTKIEINNLIFLGCTLWSNIPKENLTTVNNSMNDYRLIKFNNTTLTTTDTCQFFKEDYDWLQFQLQQLNNNNLENKKIIIITHHAPLNYGVSDPEYENSTDSFKLQLNSAFCSDCSNLMKSFKIDFWIFGHTHYSSLQKCNKTICLSNQLGYLFGGSDKNCIWKEHFYIDTDKNVEDEEWWKDVKEFQPKKEIKEGNGDNNNTDLKDNNLEGNVKKKCFVM
ncbi:hypothetical protein ABK040_016659 [Willaertia magna]